MTLSLSLFLEKQQDTKATRRFLLTLEKKPHQHFSVFLFSLESLRPFFFRLYVLFFSSFWFFDFTVSHQLSGVRRFGFAGGLGPSTVLPQLEAMSRACEAGIEKQSKRGTKRVY